MTQAPNESVRTGRGQRLQMRFVMDPRRSAPQDAVQGDCALLYDSGAQEMKVGGGSGSKYRTEAFIRIWWEPWMFFRTLKCNWCAAHELCLGRKWCWAVCHAARFLKMPHEAQRIFHCTSFWELQIMGRCWRLTLDPHMLTVKCFVQSQRQFMKVCAALLNAVC